MLDTDTSNSQDQSSERSTDGTNDEQKPKKKINNKKAFLFSFVAIVLTLALVVVGFIYTEHQIKFISASYKGETTTGTNLDNSNAGIIVTGRLKNGDIIEIPFGEWYISSPKMLEPDDSATVRITYKDLACQLTVSCADSGVASILAYYDGKTDALTKISNITEGLAVMAVLKDGTRLDVTDKCIVVDGPITLVPNKTSNITIVYTDPISEKEFSTNISVACTTKTVKQLSVNYLGEAEEGEVLDSNNKNIIVTATFNNGDIETVSGWKIDEPATLESSKIATVVVRYGAVERSLTVECSSVDPDTYRKNCKSVSYSRLMRTPEEYENTLVKISGKIEEIEPNANTSSGYIYKINTGQWNYVAIAFNGTYDNGNLIEDDHIQCYGKFVGLGEYFYEETPIIDTKFIDRWY